MEKQVNVQAACNYIHGVVPTNCRDEFKLIIENISENPGNAFSRMTVQIADWIKTGTVDKISIPTLISMSYLWGVAACASSTDEDFCRVSEQARKISQKLDALIKTRESDLRSILEEARSELNRKPPTPEEAAEQERRLNEKLNVIFPKFGDK